MIETIKKMVQAKYGDLTIESINRTGSQLISNEPGDIDFRVVVSEDVSTKSLYDPITKINLFVHSKKEFQNMCDLNVPINARLFAYIVDQTFRKYGDNNILGDSECKFKLLEYPEKYKEIVEEKVRIYTRTNTSLVERGICHKHLWWIILPLMMIENNSLDITDEMREIALKCHNMKLDRSWNDWVKDKLNLV